MGTQSSGFWVKCKGTNEKRVHTGKQCPGQCPNTRSRPCTRVRAPCPNSGVGTWKKGVFTLVPIKNRSRAPCSGTKFERSLGLLNILFKLTNQRSCPESVHVLYISMEFLAANCRSSSETQGRLVGARGINRAKKWSVAGKPATLHFFTRFISSRPN